MDKLATRTKILHWVVDGDKEKIDLDLCDFSSDQVADLDRLVRANGDNKVRLTIEPEQKKLQIPEIVANVGLVSLACREKGQELRIRGFKSPDERATALKRMCAADTPILLTIEEIAPGLFGRMTGANSDQTTITESGRDLSDANVPAPAAEGAGQNPITASLELIPLKFTGMKGCAGQIDIVCETRNWYAGYALKLGNLSFEESPLNTQSHLTRVEALRAARSALDRWLDELVITGNAATKQAMACRRDAMREQLDQQLDPIINAADSELAVTPEESDEPDPAKITR